MTRGQGIGTEVLKARVRRLAQLIGGLTVLVASAVLVGWALGLSALTSILHAAPPMAGITAVCFLLSGLAVLASAAVDPHRHGKGLNLAIRRSKDACAGIIVLTGVLKLLEFAAGWPLGIDQLVFGTPPGSPHLAVMSPATAFGFVLAGSALALSTWRGFVPLFQGLNLLTILIGWLGLNHDLFGGEPLLPYSQMAAHTCLLFILLGAGILCLRTDGGLTALMVSDTPGGMIARRLLPAAVFVPIGLRWLRMMGQLAGWYGSQAGWSLFTLANALVFGGLIWATAALLHKFDSERRAAEDQYRVLFARNPQPMWVYDAATLGFLAVNEAATDKYGYTAPEFLSMTLRDIRPPEDVPRLLESTSKPTTGLNMEGPWRHRKRDGSIITVEIVEQPIRFAGHDACLVMASDITERERLAQQLRQAQRLESIGRLAGGVAHDFNNMLTVINGYSEMLLTDAAANSPAREQLAEIRAAGERASSLTQQLLAFSRKQIIQPTILNLNDVVADIDKMLRRLIGEDIEMVTRLDPGLGNIKADASQIQQMIMNLAVNARDAMPGGGRLLIETANSTFDADYIPSHPEVRGGDYAMLAVTDNGTGMTAEVKQRLFEPFFTTKEHGKGTGLGLATVYGMVKQSGGWIWVYSEPGCGTTLKIYLPRTGQPATQAAVKLTSDVRGNEAILVVEDQIEVRTLAVAALRKYGYKVYEASSGDAALALCRQFSASLDLLITDAVMPSMNGGELARRALDIRPDLRILFMSGYTERGIAGQGGLDEDTLFLQKPFTPETLAGKARQALDRAVTKAPVNAPLS